MSSSQPTLALDDEELDYVVAENISTYVASKQQQQQQPLTTNAISVSSSSSDTPQRPKKFTNFNSPATPIHKRMDSISQTFIMNLSPLRDIKEDKFYEVETQLQTWIERTLNIQFARKETGYKEVSSSSSDVTTKKESSRNFYYNLENGYILCNLLHFYFPNYINMEKVVKFDQQLFTLTNDKTYNSNYLCNAKNNMALFLAGLRKIDGFPVDLLFNFEDVFLQKNKKLILCSLTQLHEKALFFRHQQKEIEKEYQEEQKFFEEFEEDLRSIQEDELSSGIISPRDNPELAKVVLDKLKRESVAVTPTTESLPPPPLLSTNQVQAQTKKTPSPSQRPPLPPLPKTQKTQPSDSIADFLDQLDTSTNEDNTGSAIKSIISVFSLPLVIVFVLFLKVYAIFGKKKTQ
ncbi:hypothetical protein FDP41_003119 [Naegleria fowleri]|uniref:Calponin-homology (CH) domain-containing protein n=1 Tax=Naegleria fowleri TaxID=5763 RepID=A0A6A5BLA7_NAEFO|nr:uncharacterized protein FDP41_003119 [Naegleria fowleri]KAF0977797.1 hypothetical protein FDP41_003119 [Naegleria fowleri]CAG4712415.1 unnamed protein product [Naegleria fowleri]